MRLEAADYSFLAAMECVGIERSTISNLLLKLGSGELESQLRKCEDLYTVTYLLVEGVYDSLGGLIALYKEGENSYYRTKVFPMFQYDRITALLARLDNMGIRLFHSPNLECSMKIIRAIYTQWNKSEENHNLFKKIRPMRLPVKLSANPAVPKLLALCPRMPEKVAISLIYKYETIWAILNAPDEELLAVRGMGPGLLHRLMDGVGKGAVLGY